MRLRLDYFKLQLRMFLFQHPRVIPIILIILILSITALSLIFHKQDQVQKPVTPPSAYSEIDLPNQIQEIKLSPKENFQRPMHVVMSPNNNIIVADAISNRIIALEASGKIAKDFNTTRNNRIFSYPISIATDTIQQRHYIADFNNNRVQVLDVSGKYISALPHKNDLQRVGNFKPSALATDEDGNIYAADVAQHRVLVFDKNGKFRFSFGKPGRLQGEFKFVNGIAISNTGQKIYVSDSNNGRIQVFSMQGTYLKTIDTLGNARLVSPRGLAIDEKSNLLYVADTITHQIFIYQINTGKSGVMGRLGKQAGHFNFPNGLSVDNEGKLYVADRDNRRIVVYDYPENNYILRRR